jgi:methanethiol S-methyltransferase
MWEHFFIGAAWVVYCFLHSLLAGTAFKKKAKRLMKDTYKFYRPAYTLLSFIGLVLLLWWLVVMESPRLFKSSYFILIIASVLVLSGFGLMAICIKKYFLSLSGLKTLVNENYSNELIITGIHRYVRHPLYLGTFAFIWGLWLVFPTLSFFISNLVITIYTLVGIRLEEQKLVDEFGNQYRMYQKNVPTLLPWPGKKRIIRE